MNILFDLKSTDAGNANSNATVNANAIANANTNAIATEPEKAKQNESGDTESNAEKSPKVKSLKQLNRERIAEAMLCLSNNEVNYFKF